MERPRLLLQGSAGRSFTGELKQQAETQAGRSFRQAVFGRPVFFVDGDPSADQRRGYLAAIAPGRWGSGGELPVRAHRRRAALRGRGWTGRTGC